MFAIPSALQFMFEPDETPWAPLPYVGSIPNVDAVTRIDIDRNFEILTGETYFANESERFLFVFSNLIDITNDGLLWIQSSTNDVTALGGSNSNIVINNGDIVALSKTEAARGYVATWGLLKNYGTIKAISNGFGAAGYASRSSHSWSGDTENINAGTIEAWSGEWSAVGVTFVNGTDGFTNSGTIWARGYTEAGGVLVHLGGDLVLNNSGIIDVDSHTAGRAFGVWSVSAHSTAQFQVENSGVIRADNALVFAPFNPANQISTINNTATGVIEGRIWMIGTLDTINNEGIIDGDIDLGAGADYVDNTLGVILGSINLGAHDDLFLGGALGEVVAGKSGNDTLMGGGGNDALTDAGGNDSLDGGEGDDTLIGGIGADTLEGGDDTDTASYARSSAAVVIDLLAGTGSGGDAAGDLLSGIENLIGSDFDDTLHGDDADNIFWGGAGADSLDGGGGNDTASYDGSGAAVSVDLLNALASGGDAQGDALTSIESLIGSKYDDMLAGDIAANGFEGGGGADTLYGDAGNDTLDGGGGADLIFGGGDDDVIIGGLGADELRGEAGSDTIDGGGGKDTLIGREGNDSLSGGLDDDRLFGGDGDDTLDGGARDDFRVSGQNGNDLLFGGIGVDEVFGGQGNDTLDAGGGNDRGIGGAGDDSVYGGAGDDFVTGGAGADTVDGGNGNDTVIGGAGNDLLIGGAGEDSLTGGDDNDTLQGGNLGDTLKGQNGDDVLIGGSGDDSLVGGAGNDRFIFGVGEGADVISDFTAGMATDDVIDLSGFVTGLDEFSEVIAAASQVGADTVIDFGGGASLTLLGVATGDLHSDDFLFT
ncbi:calcium-binding protein [Hyphococcus sp.]|uniref:calcium-binding protein n=1 Tax=Hyphococcus sp. TaxID=2038636 RepID=UPI00208084C1|nr:MAG: hypothetical protein DHS20C04_26110 [Marinicaulis sp.]